MQFSAAACVTGTTSATIDPGAGQGMRRSSTPPALTRDFCAVGTAVAAVDAHRIAVLARRAGRCPSSRRRSSRAASGEARIRPRSRARGDGWPCTSTGRNSHTCRAPSTLHAATAQRCSVRRRAPAASIRGQPTNSPTIATAASTPLVEQARPPLPIDREAREIAHRLADPDQAGARERHQQHGDGQVVARLGEEQHVERGERERDRQQRRRGPVAARERRDHAHQHRRDRTRTRTSRRGARRRRDGA